MSAPDIALKGGSSINFTKGGSLRSHRVIAFNDGGSIDNIGTTPQTIGVEPPPIVIFKAVMEGGLERERINKELLKSLKPPDTKNGWRQGERKSISKAERKKRKAKKKQGKRDRS